MFQKKKAWIGCCFFSSEQKKSREGKKFFFPSFSCHPVFFFFFHLSALPRARVARSRKGTAIPGDSPKTLWALSAFPCYMFSKGHKIPIEPSILVLGFAEAHLATLPALSKRGRGNAELTLGKKNFFLLSLSLSFSLSPSLFFSLPMRPLAPT